MLDKNNDTISENKNIILKEKNSFSLDLIEDFYSNDFSNNAFSVFKSINIIYIIYSNLDISIISYNLIKNEKINEIKNAHQKNITNFRYYLDKIKKRELILSISSLDNNIKLWHIKNWECLFNIKDINKYGYLYSACILNDKNNIYIITSNYYIFNPDPIKVYDINLYLDLNKIKEINDSYESTKFITTYYDIKKNKNYIITGNKGYLKSYDFNLNKVYHKYNYGLGWNTGLINIFKEEDDDIIRLLESDGKGIIRIWNFHTEELLKEIIIKEIRHTYGFCFWDKKYLFLGCEDNDIKLIDLRNGKNIYKLIGHEDDVICIKKIKHPDYGECLITSDSSGIIKLWFFT